MIPLWAIKAGAGALLSLALFGGWKWREHVVYHRGELAEHARGEARAKIESDRADAQRDALNKQIAVAQASLTAARANLALLKLELDNEKAISSDRQRRLLAGTERMRVLVRARPPGPNGSPGGFGTGLVDTGADVVADLAGGTAAAIDQLRVDHNEAVRRLEACVIAYDAVKAAADAMP